MTLFEALLALTIAGLFLMIISNNIVYALVNYNLVSSKDRLLKLEKSMENVADALIKYYQKNLNEYKNNDVSLYPYVENNLICYKVASIGAKNIIKNEITKDVVLFKDDYTKICFKIPNLSNIKIYYTFLNGKKVEAKNELNDYSKVYLGEDLGSDKLNIYKIPVKVEIKAKLYGTPIKAERVIENLKEMIKETKHKIEFLYNLLKKYDAVRYSDELLNVYPKGLPSEDDIKIPWVVQIFNSNIYAKCNLESATGYCSNIHFPSSKNVKEVESRMKNIFALSEGTFITPFLNKIHVYLLTRKSDLRYEDLSFNLVESPHLNYPSNVLTYGVIVEDNEICKKNDDLEGICRKELFYER